MRRSVSLLVAPLVFLGGCGLFEPIPTATAGLITNLEFVAAHEVDDEPICVTYGKWGCEFSIPQSHHEPDCYSLIFHDDHGLSGYSGCIDKDVFFTYKIGDWYPRKS